MKSTKSNQSQQQTNAEHWVEIARKFGEKCVAIQKDPNLSLDQKLEKQKSLSNEMLKEVRDDTHLKEDEKKNMLETIKSYIDDWAKIHDILKDTTSEKKPTEAKKHK